MATTSKVIDVDRLDPETSINTILTSLSIDAADFLDAVVIKVEEPNQSARIVIFYDDGT